MNSSTTTPFDTEADTPTFTVCSGERTLAIPYINVKSLELTDNEICIDTAGFLIRVVGSELGRLWKDLRLYRVLEIGVTVGKASKALGDQVKRCAVDEIEITDLSEAIADDG